MTYLSFRTAALNPMQGFRATLAVVSSQVYYTGYQSLPLISGLAIASSAMVVLQSSSQFNLFGGGNTIGRMMMMLIVREMAPLLTALIVIARSGTAVASEIGNMRVNREIEALEVMGINPLSYIVFPRILGGIISVMCLALYFLYVANISGFIFAKIFLNMPLNFYVDAIMQVIAKEDVLLFACKNLVGGAIIFTICCYQGMQVKQGPQEVPQATTAGVVNSIIYVIAFNMIVTILFYMNQIIKMGFI
ncbi:MAG: ABC transporter permease [Bdellovibrionales bacterium RBG_16_40_8]|nr:MAG: ABC transporter permease [Bdellovibrionales bacterium RBG_16_40_8]